MIKALSGAEAAAKFAALMAEYKTEAALRILRQPWASLEDAKSFVGSLEPRTIDALAASVSRAHPLFREAYFARVLSDPELAPVVAMSMVSIGQPIPPEELARIPVSTLASQLPRLATPMDGYKGLVEFVNLFPRERRAELKLDGVGGEVLRMLDDPTAPAPAFEADAAAGFRSDFQVGFVEERPNPVAYAASRLARYPSPLRNRAATVLLRLMDDESPGHAGRTVGSWATETVETLMERGEIAG